MMRRWRWSAEFGWAVPFGIVAFAGVDRLALSEDPREGVASAGRRWRQAAAEAAYR